MTVDLFASVLESIIGCGRRGKVFSSLESGHAPMLMKTHPLKIAPPSEILQCPGESRGRRMRLFPWKKDTWADKGGR